MEQLRGPDRGWGLSFAGAPPVNLHPSSVLSRVWTSPTSNINSFRDDAWTDLAARVAAEGDPAKLKPLSLELDDYLLDQSWFIPMTSAPPKIAARANVRGVVLMPTTRRRCATSRSGRRKRGRARIGATSTGRHACRSLACFGERLGRRGFAPGEPGGGRESAVGVRGPGAIRATTNADDGATQASGADGRAHRGPDIRANGGADRRARARRHA